MPRIISVPFIALTKKEHPLPGKPAPGSRANWLKKPNIVPANFPIPLGFFPNIVLNWLLCILSGLAIIGIQSTVFQ